jgi:subtilisin family serine protease
MQTTGLTTSAGGTGMNTAVLAGGLPLGFDPAIWSHGAYPQLVNLGPQDTTPGDPVIPPVQSPVELPVEPPTEPTTAAPSLPPANQQVNPNGLQFANAVQTRDSVNVLQLAQEFLAQQKGPPANSTAEPGGAGAGAGPGRGPTQTIQGPAGPVQIPGQAPIRLDVGDNRYFYLPPPGETRLVSNEVVLQLPCDVPRAELDAILSQHNLTVLGEQCLQPGGNAAYRVRHANNRAIASVIRALAANRIIAAAQANYVYALQEDTSVQSVTSEQGDPGQYVPEKLHLEQIHRLVKGTDVRVAVIDSEIDRAHPDLRGAIVERYDAAGAEDTPHPHGTGMAGAIVSRQKLLGVAPGARVLAIHAFSTRAASSESTTYNILKGLTWAVDHNVRVVNMSFAGPRDPSLERAFKEAYDKGVVLIAAAGNAGPRSPPLFPAADPHVIAVTATDIDDQLFTGANRGRYLAIAAPGVDILVPAPSGEYQVTTGTSVATAHISGVVALLLERNPKLTPADVRRILMGSAKRLGPTDQFGAGLVDPVRALEMATPRSAAVPGAARR